MATELVGAIAERSLIEQPMPAFGDRRRHCRDMRALARTTIDDAPTLPVRCASEKCEAALMFVDERTGRVVRIDRVATIPGPGSPW